MDRDGLTFPCDLFGQQGIDPGTGPFAGFLDELWTSVELIGDRQFALFDEGKQAIANPLLDSSVDLVDSARPLGHV
jgi:hypothetical protein